MSRSSNTRQATFIFRLLSFVDTYRSSFVGTYSPFVARLGATFRLLTTDHVLLLGITLIAFALRLPFLMDLPRFTDEVGEIAWAWRIYRGEHLPLTGYPLYIGPLYAYTLALLFWLVGPHVLLPRMLLLAAGLGTVALTFVLGRRLGGRNAGLLAPALVALAPVHILLNSRVAWANNLTPLFTTLALLLLLQAIERRSGPHMLASGLVWGLALQTHPTVAVLLPGLAVWFLMGRGRRAWLHRPALWLALLAFLAAYAPVIAFNLLHTGASSADAEQGSAAYEFVRSVGQYGQNLVALLLSLLRLLGMAELPPTSLLAWQSWLLAGYAGLLLGGLTWATRRGAGWAVAMVTSTTLLLPTFCRQYEFGAYGLPSRYLAMLLPVVACGVAGVLFNSRQESYEERRKAKDEGRTSLVLSSLSQQSPPVLLEAYRNRNSKPNTRNPALTLLALTFLIATPTISLLRFYERNEQEGISNKPIWAALSVVDAAAVPEQPILIDERLDGGKLFGGGRLRTAFVFLFDMKRMPHITIPPHEWEATLAHAPHGTLALLSPQTRRALLEHNDTFGGRRITLERLYDYDEGAKNLEFRVYRLAVSD